ncbi:MerR family transcriptional regulator [Stappia sp. BW2]|uniref:MerR family transcriptional regulator n=1 Tax=Stappia sp. BW2 TaxID=2592622 RepID=UPI0011DEC660|nr:MerR family transcriptional regulator [Stappia sp. BW2]TYC67898.1 MerR family transcriptional regulator [Stappia sp. BW2]
MQIKEAAERLGITERMLRHYEKSGLMETRRSENGYRSYSAADLRRAGRIRDFIATGFSTREIRAMAACLSDEGAGPCEGGIPQLLKKLEHIDRLTADLEAKRKAILDRLAVLEDVSPVRTEEKVDAQARGGTSLSGRGPSASGGHHTDLEPHASGR